MHGIRLRRIVAHPRDFFFGAGAGNGDASVQGGGRGGVSTSHRTILTTNQSMVPLGLEYPPRPPLVVAFVVFLLVDIYFNVDVIHPGETQ